MLFHIFLLAHSLPAAMMASFAVFRGVMLKTPLPDCPPPHTAKINRNPETSLHQPLSDYISTGYLVCPARLDKTAPDIGATTPPSHSHQPQATSHRTTSKIGRAHV